ncbi:two component transcriptional regulator, LuxR family [Quadrisphaera granulorum]|uniref:LuxR family two component transcriptional regulator n=1 Tax=Quadrisphaera granulorum TaxID=317664 RepID=A0A315ZTY9_9ACTN|nr:response regulator transcription factor [Quadrisphaera granulorum]PWJ49016.1 LuxR family two component transcriptional regulator [Quadrisphaera granulorum]SZE98226.1 two component transcriptional regulator, LuxR family [Quadrisphaera granulorum]
MSGLRVALLDDHQLLSQALAAALAAVGHRPELPALSTSPDDAALVAELASQPPDVVVLDLHLGARDPAGGDRLLRRLAPAVPVLVLTAEEDPARWGRCLRAGARGVVSKQRPLPDVVSAVERAAAGADLHTPAQRAALLHAAAAADRALAPFRSLTPREQAVLDALVDGVPAADIARDACVSEATVRTQIRAVLTKLGVRSQLAAAAAARRAGFIDFDDDRMRRRA